MHLCILPHRKKTQTKDASNGWQRNSKLPKQKTPKRQPKKQQKKPKHEMQSKPKDL